MALPSSQSMRTSGDFRADRLYAYGDAALAEGDHSAARDCFAEVAARVPGWPPAAFALAKALAALGEKAAAMAALERVLALDPADRLGAGLLLAQLGGAPPGRSAMPDAYIAALFDEYAPRFDQHLVEALDYRAPEWLAALIAEAAPGRRFGQAIDLGCGTGLMARALAGACDALTGVDLSAGMLAKAARTGLYAGLHHAGIAGFLAGAAGGSADLVLAADVFCYVPDLAPIFSSVARLLSPGGLFAFSIQTHEGAGIIIGEDARIHHPPGLILSLAAGADLAIVRESRVSTRLDRGAPVPGALFVLARR